MPKSKYVYRNQIEFEKLKEVLQERMQTTTSKAWQTRYKKELSGLNKSWAQRQRIEREKAADPSWQPFQGKRFKPTKASIQKGHITKAHQWLKNTRPKTHSINIQRRRQEKILFGKPKTRLHDKKGRLMPLVPKRTPEDRTRSLNQHKQMKEKHIDVKARGQDPDVAAADSHNPDEDTYRNFKEWVMSDTVKDMRKLSKKRAMAIVQNPEYYNRVRNLIGKIEDAGLKERMYEKFGMKPRYQSYSKHQTFHGHKKKK